jgi:hypothetical protein
MDPSLIMPIRMMKDAIRLLNDNENVKIDQISVLRRLDLSCDKKAGVWFGSGEPIGRFDLIDTLVKISVQDSSTAEELAGDLKGGVNRVRTLAAIADSRIRAAHAANGNARR